MRTLHSCPQNLGIQICGGPGLLGLCERCTASLAQSMDIVAVGHGEQACVAASCRLAYHLNSPALNREAIFERPRCTCLLR